MIRRALVIGLLVAAVCGLRMVASAPAAQAAGGPCSLPVASTVCGAVSGLVSGVFNGVGWTFDKATGTVKLGDKIIGKIVSVGEGYACDKVAPVALLAKLCKKIVGKLSGGSGGSGGSSGGGSTAAGGGAAAGGTSTTVVEPAPVDSTPADAPQSYLRTSAIATAAAAAMGTVAHDLGKETTANVASSWFQSLYGRTAKYAAGLALLALLFALADGAAHGDGELVAQALRAVPYAVVVTVGVSSMVALAVLIVDDAGVIIGGSGLSDARHVLDLLAVLFVALGAAAKGLSTHHATLAKMAAFPAAMFSIFGVVGAGMVAAELLLRETAIYAGTLFAPLILAARIYPRLAHAGARLGQTLMAVILSKLALVMMLALAGEAVLHGGMSGIAMGAAALFVAAFAPMMLYGMISLAEHGFHARAAAADAGMTAASASQRMGEIVAGSAARIDRVRGQYYAGSGSAGSGSGSGGSGEPPAAPSVDVPPPRRDPPSVPPVTPTLAEEEADGE
jgi:hypothetical protein